jgi:hypothetical protein
MLISATTVLKLFTLYRINIVADWGSVYSQNAWIVAFYATDQQCDTAPLLEVVHVAPHDFCNAPIASVNSLVMHFVRYTSR